jgi:hypothetical protein
MGRWAQRTRGGGGINAINYIVGLGAASSGSMYVQYANAIDASQLLMGDFFFNPTGEFADSLVQLDSHRIEVTIAGLINSENEVIYTGSTPGIQTPQTFNI